MKKLMFAVVMLLWALPAAAQTISLTQQQATPSTTTSCAGPLAPSLTGVVGGHTLIFCLKATGSTTNPIPTTVTDSAGGSFTQTASFGDGLYLYCKQNVQLTGTHTVSAQFVAGSGTCAIGANLLEFANVTCNPDASALSNSGTGTTLTTAAQFGAPTANDLYMACFGSDGASETYSVPTNSFTLLNTAGAAGGSLGGSYKAPNATGTVSTGVTANVSKPWVAGLIPLQATPFATPTASTTATASTTPSPSPSATPTPNIINELGTAGAQITIAACSGGSTKVIKGNTTTTHWTVICAANANCELGDDSDNAPLIAPSATVGFPFNANIYISNDSLGLTSAEARNRMDCCGVSGETTCATWRN